MIALPLTSRKLAGRFAPTPSGPLHFGSLVTAVASYCQARAQRAGWIIRIEDVDTPRVVKGSADDILNTLEAFGFEWDGQVVFQSQRFEAYHAALQQLQDQDLIYRCACSRKQLKAQPHRNGPLGLIYPGHCRFKSLQNSQLGQRLNLQNAGKVFFTDIHAGAQTLNLTDEVGDIVVKRRDGIFAYHLAVVVDDAFQQITQIVRGADLLNSTFVHIWLNRLLGYRDAEYLHLPLVTNEKGSKLSKQTGARALDIKHKENLLLLALQFLGQPTPEPLKKATAVEILQHAITHWDISKIPAIKTCQVR